MQIKIAKTAGFCFGVNRAVDLIYALLEQGKSVCTLGPLIHNPQVIEDLKSRGVKIIETPSEASAGSTIVIRTHGVPKAIKEQIDSSNDESCDATCPFVKKIHRIVSEHSREDNIVLIAGDKSHPEVQGIRSYCIGQSYVFKNADELEEILNTHPNIKNCEITAVAQTTFSVKEWDLCTEKIKILCTNANLFDTICNATHDRQHEARDLAAASDVMIIIGGRQSSNTAKLYAVCNEISPTYLIEDPAELYDIDFFGYNYIGVTAGASTPAGIIKEVLQTMSEILNENVTEEIVKEDATEVQSNDEMDFFEALEESLKSMSSDQKVRGVVMGINPTEIQVDIGRKHAGYVPIDEYSSDPNADPQNELKIGDEINLIIMKTNDAEGTVMLSKKRYDAAKSWNEIIDAAETDTVFEGTVVEVIKGGILVLVNGVRVFVPASLATESRGDSLEALLNTNVKLRIIEVNRQRKRAVGSIRAVLKDSRKEAADAFWAQAAEGQVYKGIVKSMTSYGAFVDIGGVDGMIHISELSWKRIKHPSDVVSIGQEVEVHIKALDFEKRKISLGYKKLSDNPWEILRRTYEVGSVIESEIIGMTTFGAFATVIPGIDGLIHISQIA
ncbi:MAG: bifunctional 4-hydroxy-3-methylbut-2-enyl diphosphate reductase/30S ribosomal protein S1, partial [Clostridiales bacterium]|nr:bifunctional 4-hydroxy-3-methylbut-2-enyl diphosphate reductase/30S ribosomal protein S1 [Clostridiales bacterium]